MAPSLELNLKTLVEMVLIVLFNPRMLLTDLLHRALLYKGKQSPRSLFYRNMVLEQLSLRSDAQDNSDSPTHPERSPRIYVPDKNHTSNSLLHAHVD